VRAVAGLGAGLGVSTTAEGVETQAQFEVAGREGSTEAQGFWIGRPMNGAAIAERDDLYRGTTKPKRRPSPAPDEARASAAKIGTQPRRRAKEHIANACARPNQR
jgi:predicted signal transduction protein with EAL and GGDEF domain